jgi:hypothetical protein
MADSLFASPGGGHSAPRGSASERQAAIWRQTMCVCAVLIAICSHATSATAQILLAFNGEDRWNMKRVVEAAAARLADCGCQEVLFDFVDEQGVLLATRLAATGRNPVEAFTALRFVNKPLAPQCRTGNRLAFTFPGSQVIYVCSLKLRNESIRSSIRTELILIHEFLHSLGLGENPPTSQYITRRVGVRCDG